MVYTAKQQQISITVHKTVESFLCGVANVCDSLRSDGVRCGN